jgi:hypothetical protein
MAKDVSPIEQAAATRDLARRARRLAQALTLDADRVRLLQYAEELEEQANRLEAAGREPQTQVQQQQMQEQQQESSDAPDPPTDKPKPH